MNQGNPYKRLLGLQLLYDIIGYTRRVLVSNAVRFLDVPFLMFRIYKND